MVFSSLFFVFFFLTLNLLLYNLVDGIEKKNMVMLVFSLIFYSWAGPKYLILLLGMVFISWFTAIMIEEEECEKEVSDSRLCAVDRTSWHI